jgi:hypothetical protein
VIVKDKTAICFVAHQGFLEIQSVLLAVSLKFFNPNQFELFAAVPKFLGGIRTGISESTAEILSSLGVRFIETDNLFKQDYLIGNKFGCLNTIKGYKKRLFLDTDIMCCAPLKLPEITVGQIAVKPADRKTYSWTSAQWVSAYLSYTGTKAPTNRVISSCFKEKMYPYFNAGVIYLNSSVEFGDEWQKLAKRLDDDDNFSNKRPWLDQLALPLAIQQHQLETVILDEAFNFPANIKNEIGANTQLVHYHKPKNIARNPFLLAQISQLMSTCPELEALFESDAEWKVVNEVLASYKKHRIKIQQPPTNLLITGIPRSGTSLISSLLAKQPQNVVINEPPGFPKPLKRRSFPWGIHGLFMDLRRDIVSQTPVLNKHKGGELIEDTVDDNSRRPQVFPGIGPDFNLIVKNTLAGLIGLERIKQTFPSLQLLICFRDPIDTLASWKTSFDHLKDARPTNIGVISSQMEWLNQTEYEQLMAVENESNDAIRRALLWCFLADKIIRLAEGALLVNYRNLTNHTATQFQIINQHIDISTGNLDVNLESRSKRDLLSAEEVKVIQTICGPAYSDLCQLATGF